MKNFFGFTQPAILLAALFLVSGLYGYYYISRSKESTAPIPIASTTPEPSPKISPSPIVATPSASVGMKSITTNTTTIIPKSGFYLGSVNLQTGSERRLLILTGNGFGSNFNKIIFDDETSKYSDYGLYNWNNTKIELFLSKDIPDNVNVKVAIIKTDGVKSNTLTFNSKTWDKSANSVFDCTMPTNFRGSAISSTEAKLEWDTDPNVKRFQVLQSFNTENGEPIWLYPRSITSFENTPNGSVNIPGLTPNSYNYFSLTVSCNNGYASAPTPTLTVTTPN